MSLLRNLARTYVVHRLSQGDRHRLARSGRRRPSSAPYPSRYRGRRSRQRSGFRMVGPLPTYSRRTRGGSRVTVSGCCLPIPLALTLGAAVASRHALRVG